MMTLSKACHSDHFFLMIQDLKYSAPFQKVSIYHSISRILPLEGVRLRQPVNVIIDEGQCFGTSPYQRI